MLRSTPLDARARLREMAAAYRASQLVFLTARLRLADHLASGPRSPEELADATGTQRDPLRRVLRGMASLGLLEEAPDGRFNLTALSEPLRSDHPASLRQDVLFTAARENTLAWASLEQTLFTGVSGFEHAFGMPRFEYLQAHPEWAAIFQSQMSLQMVQVARAVVAAYDFAGLGTVADVGGGHGTLLAAILDAYPGLNGILFDLPEVVAGAEEPLRLAGVLSRCRMVGGDFFQSVPDDADLYLLSWIVHDWPDEQAARILATCATHLRPGTRLLLIEGLQPQRAEDTAATREALLSDLHMLAVLTGRNRTRSEFEALLQAAGFRLERVIPTASPRAILEAVRV